MTFQYRHITSALAEVICQNIYDSDTVLPIREIQRKTAPPVSVLVERRAKELTWIKLFPDGKNGLNEDRPLKVTLFDYFQALVMGSDQRFQNGIYANLRAINGRARQNISVYGSLRQDGVQPADLFQNIHLSTRNLRGISLFWHRAYSELMKMVG